METHDVLQGNDLVLMFMHIVLIGMMIRVMIDLTWLRKHVINKEKP